MQRKQGKWSKKAQNGKKAKFFFQAINPQNKTKKISIEFYPAAGKIQLVIDCGFLGCIISLGAYNSGQDQYFLPILEPSDSLNFSLLILKKKFGKIEKPNRYKLINKQR